MVKKSAIFTRRSFLFLFPHSFFNLKKKGGGGGGGGGAVILAACDMYRSPTSVMPMTNLGEQCREKASVKVLVLCQRVRRPTGRIETDHNIDSLCLFQVPFPFL